MDKIELRQAVLEELEYEPSIDAAHIGVLAEGGVVTLTGYVTTYPQKMAGEAAAKRVRGVRAIANDIEIRYVGRSQTADDEIAKRALDVLRWSAPIPAERIQVTVRNGWVTLSGEVSWHYQRQAAEEAVHKLSGVLAISNNITLEPAAQVANIKSKIEGALKRRAEIEASRIGVTVGEGGSVTLVGKVDNWDEKHAIEAAAWAAPGVRTVEDQITVV